MMTVANAYALLKEGWPRQSFNISLDVWHHDHTDSGEAPVTTIEWSVYDEEDRVHYYGPTLENAIEQALGAAADLEMTEAELYDLEMTRRVDREKER
jgi:hypothetical protein